MKIISILALMVAVLFVPAQARAGSLDDAHRAFAGGHYQESTLGYQAVLAQNGYSAPVLFDLGNSYYREDDFAQAILAYKRAQWLSPNDPDIATNLHLAQKQAGLSVAESRWSDKVAGVLSASGWAWLGSGAWTLICLSILARAAFPQRRSLSSVTGTAGFFVLFVTLAAIVISFHQLHQAVVIDKNASVLISPFAAAQAVFSPPPGETVTIQKAYNDFLLVTDGAARTGWISKAQIAPVIPSSPAGFAGS